MTRLHLSPTSPAVLALIVASLSALPACGSKGGDDDSAGGMGGTGGSGAMGGSSGSSGSSASGGGGGMMMARSVVFPFDSDEQSWSVQYTSSGKDAALKDIPAIDTTAVTVQWTTGKGDGDMAGALEAKIPYASPRQYVGLGIHLSFEDLTDKLITARVKLESGIVSDADIASKTPGAKIYVKASGDEYVYAAGVYQSFTSFGNWTTLKMDLKDPTSWSYVDKGTTDAPKTFDPSMVGELGVQFDSPDDLTTAVIEGSVLIDNVTY